MSLQSAVTQRQRMAALEDFIVFWLGPRRPEFGEPDTAMNGLNLPGPLHHLYALAGRWPRPHPDTTDETRVFSVQDHLRSLDQLQWTADGKLVFLDENQGNWTCATLPTGDDPPVWVEDVFDAYQQGKWGLVSNSLSRFLATFCLQEVLYGSQLCLSDTNLLSLFRSSQEEVVSLWENGTYAYWMEPFNYYLWRGCVLVGQIHGGCWFSANHADGIRFLTAHQGEVRELGLGSIGSWSLHIDASGAATITLANWFDSSARTPPGTFDFASTRDELLAACSDQPEEASPWHAWFPRSGQSWSRGTNIVDIHMVRRFFRTALAAVVSKDVKFDELLKQFPLPV